jgi:hypothetical protein
MTAIKRNGRCFGEVKITKQEKDGYSNHIYHEINYMSKALNTSIGVGSNKRVVNDKSNILMSAIHITQKDLTRKFRKFCKDHQPIDSSDSEIEVIVKPDRKKKTKEPKAKEPETLKSDSEDDAETKEPETKEPDSEDDVETKEPETKEPDSEDDVETKEPDTKEPETKEPDSEEEVDAKESDSETKESDSEEDVETKESDSEEEPDVKDESEPKEENMSVLESMQIYKTMLKGDDIPSDILTHVSNQIQLYLDNCPQALIALKYVPMDKSRIKMLLDIMEHMHPEIQN